MGGKRKSNAGRPTVMTKDTIYKLEEAFLMGCPDEEACLNAGISTDCLYLYQRKNPEFIKRKEQLKQTPFLVARTTINKAIKENPQYAFEYMKRKKKKEFGDNVDITSDGEKITQEVTSEQVSRFINRHGKGET